ncbi:hypothetical protein [Paenibacillus piri]|nr:hypothetical protein [Paenibacillus piri]
MRATYAVLRQQSVAPRRLQALTLQRSQPNGLSQNKTSNPFMGL